MIAATTAGTSTRTDPSIHQGTPRLRYSIMTTGWRRHRGLEQLLQSIGFQRDICGFIHRDSPIIGLTPDRHSRRTRAFYQDHRRFCTAGMGRHVRPIRPAARFATACNSLVEARASASSRRPVLQSNFVAP